MAFKGLAQGHKRKESAMKYYDKVHTGSFEGHSHVTRVKKPKSKKRTVSKRELLIKDMIEVLRVSLRSEEDINKIGKIKEEITFLKQQLYYTKH